MLEKTAAEIDMVKKYLNINHDLFLLDLRVTMPSIEELRKIAQLNLCGSCYKKYLAFLEPTIKEYVERPLSDWGEVEEHVTYLAMRKWGVFRNDKIVSFKDGEENDFPDEIDGTAYRSFKKERLRTISAQIKYLHREGVFGENTFKLLEKARVARNKIHPSPDAAFTKEDYGLFYVAKGITSQLRLFSFLNPGKEMPSEMRIAIEKFAEQYLANGNANDAF